MPGVIGLNSLTCELVTSRLEVGIFRDELFDFLIELENLQSIEFHLRVSLSDVDHHSRDRPQLLLILIRHLVHLLDDLFLGDSTLRTDLVIDLVSLIFTHGS